jgi:hypothetical protein
MRRPYAPTAALPVALALALATAGCDAGSPAVPTAGPAAEASVGLDAAGDAGPSYAVCPPGMDASFGSIYTQMLSTASCGSQNPTSCHSTNGSLTTGSLLDYSLDAGAVYAELLGDGGGARATNIDHPDVHVLRVVPFDASASMLYIKLTIGSSDPSYGAGMPLTAPGSVCPEARAAVEAWINAGAQQN